MDQQTTIPNHLGIILDGNRRWAKAQGLSSISGHNAGYQNFKDITKYAFDKGVSYVSAYVFSTENWERKKEEVKFLMGLALKVLTKDLAELNEKNIKIVWLGNTDRLSNKLVKAIRTAEEKTKKNSYGTLCLCFNYGGHQEIVDAVKKIVAAKTPDDQINFKTIEKSLYAPDVPPVDLVIRTSGEHRTSGFMLYRAAYAELYFTPLHWPEFKKNDLDKALEEYAFRNRRFGK